MKRQLYKTINDWVLTTYGSSFPPNIIELAFEYIENTPQLLSFYESLIGGNVGQVTRHGLNSQIGRHIREALGAKVLQHDQNPAHTRLIKRFSTLTK